MIFFFERTQIRSEAASPITTDGIPLKFVSTGNLTSADRLTFCWSIRIAVQKALRPKSGHWFRNLKGLIAGGFSHCLLPSPHSAIVFFFVLGSAFARLYLLLYKAQKKKHTKKNASYVRRLCLWEITSTPYYGTPASSPLQLYASRPSLLYKLKRAGH